MLACPDSPDCYHTVCHTLCRTNPHHSGHHHHAGSCAGGVCYDPRLWLLQVAAHDHVEGCLYCHPYACASCASCVSYAFCASYDALHLVHLHGMQNLPQIYTSQSLNETQHASTVWIALSGSLADLHEQQHCVEATCAESAVIMKIYYSSSCHLLTAASESLPSLTEGPGLDTVRPRPLPGAMLSPSSTSPA